MFELRAIIETVGLFGVIAMVFAESGLLIGFFLPGDSLLFTAGFLASQGIFRIDVLTGLAFLAAIAGDSVGYAFGHRVGRNIFTREDSLLFHKDNLLRAEQFYKRHGGKTIILARFLPVVRTFAPILAGVGAMEYRQFLIYNIVGGALWAGGLSLLGYFIGSVIPDVDRYLLPMIGGIILVSVLPTALHLLRHKEDRERMWQGIRKIVRKGELRKEN